MSSFQLIPPLDLALADYTTSVAENDAPVWASGTTYQLGNEVIRDHKVFVSAENNNLGNDPLLEDQDSPTAKWIFKSYTNAFRFVDGTIVNKTTNATDFTIDVANVSGVAALLFVWCALFDNSGAGFRRDRH